MQEKPINMPSKAGSSQEGANLPRADPAGIAEIGAPAASQNRHFFLTAESRLRQASDHILDL